MPTLSQALFLALGIQQQINRQIDLLSWSFYARGGSYFRIRKECFRQVIREKPVTFKVKQSLNWNSIQEYCSKSGHHLGQGIHLQICMNVGNILFIISPSRKDSKSFSPRGEWRSLRKGLTVSNGCVHCRSTTALPGDCGSRR